MPCWHAMLACHAGMPCWQRPPSSVLHCTFVCGVVPGRQALLQQQLLHRCLEHPATVRLAVPPPPRHHTEGGRPEPRAPPPPLLLPLLGLVLLLLQAGWSRLLLLLLPLIILS